MINKYFWYTELKIDGTYLKARYFSLTIIGQIVEMAEDLSVDYAS